MTAEFPRSVRELVLKRADGICERCGTPGVDFQLHHRRARGMGSTCRPESALPANAGALCPDCHREVESQRADALFTGWLVSQYREPAEVPVLRCGQWVLLDDNGGWTVRG